MYECNVTFANVGLKNSVLLKNFRPMPNFRFFFAPLRIYCVASQFDARLKITRRDLYYVIRGLPSLLELREADGIAIV